MVGLRKILIILLSICLGTPAVASGGGEGEEAKKSASVPEWVEIQNRLQTLKAKLSAKEKTVRELIAAQRSGHHAPASGGAGHGGKSATLGGGDFATLQKEHRELKALAEEYEQQRNVLRYRYPEKGLRDDRKYHRVEIQSLEEMENQMGFEGRLRRTFKKVEEKYGAAPSLKPDSAPVQDREPASVQRDESVMSSPVMAK